MDIDQPDVLLVLCPGIGHPRYFASLGLGHLKSSLEAAGFDARVVNLSELLYRLDEPLYQRLYEAGSLERFHHTGVWGFSAGYLDRIVSGKQDATLGKALNAFADVSAERIIAARPGVVGLSLVQSNLAFALALCKRLATAGLPVIAGGPSARETAIAERMFEAGCRLVITGEAELTLPELIQEFRATGRLPDPGTVLAGLQISDLDALPAPHFDTAHPLHWLPVATSRGCTCRCHFCEEATLFRSFRRRSVRHVVAEIAINRERFQPRGVLFHDSLINHDRAWLLDLARTLRQEQPGLKWLAFARPEGLDAELLEAMATAGCCALHFGVEHFAQPVSEALGKRLDVHAAYQTIDRTAEHGIPVKLLLITGAPGETDHDHRANVAAVQGLLKTHPGLINLAINPLMITPHSTYMRNPAKFGIQLVHDAAGAVQGRVFEAGPNPSQIERNLAEIEALKPTPRSGCLD